MSHRPVDLLPESVRLKALAGRRTGRMIGAGLIVVAALVAAASHAHLSRASAQRELDVVREEAQRVLAKEREIERLRRDIAHGEAALARYESYAPPIETGRILATLVNLLPEGATLDSLDLDTGMRRVVRTARGLPSRDGDDEATQPDLHGEVGGFAPDDEAIARFVARLGDQAPFEQVSLDFSRTREVRGRAAREFRLSFRIPMARRYELMADAGEGGRP